MYKLDEVTELLKDNWICVTACGNGLFTTGGHFITLVGIDDNIIKVYDPYLYSGKFNTSTRRGKATVNGNTVYVTTDNFRNYANYGTFFCFKNDRQEIKENPTEIIMVKEEPKSFENYTAKVIAKSGLNARAGASTSYVKKSGYRYGTILTIVAESNGWGKTTDGYWVCLDYVSRTATEIKSTVGQYKRFKTTYTYIYSNSNLSGNAYTYLANTKVKILENVTQNVDKIYVPATGRTGFVNIRVYR